MGKYWRKFGCEFEFSASFEDVLDASSIAIKKFYGKNMLKSVRKHYSSVNNKSWNLKLDSTTGCELATPVSKISDIRKICSVIQYMARKDINITKSDSFHIHMESRDVPKDNIVISWMQLSNVISGLYPKYRRSSRNSYAINFMTYSGKSKRLSEFFKSASSSAEDHYAAMSLERYDKGNIEFRLGEATFDCDVITTFVKLYMLFMNYAKKINVVELLCETNTIVKSVYVLFDLLKVESQKMMDIMIERTRKFK